MTETENTAAAFAVAASSLLKIREDWMDSNYCFRGELSLTQWLYEFCIMRVASGRSIGHTTWITSVITDADYLVVPNRTVGPPSTAKSRTSSTFHSLRGIGLTRCSSHPRNAIESSSTAAGIKLTNSFSTKSLQCSDQRRRLSS